MNVLCVVAHPDDEVLGVGGTLAEHARQGDEVTVLALSNGVMARHEERTDAVEQEIERRRNSAHTACERLGVSALEFEDFPDNQFDTLPLLKIVQRVEARIDDIEPEIVYTHHYGDLNVDHRLTSKAVLTATRPLADCPVREVLAFETLSASEWGVPSTANAFQPTVFQDVSDTLPDKLDAMSAYDAELRSGPHPRTLDTVEANAEVWGAKSGIEAAEPFELLRAVRSPNAAGTGE